jgi:hypothetical protein
MGDIMNKIKIKKLYKEGFDKYSALLIMNNIAKISKDPCFKNIIKKAKLIKKKRNNFL